MKIKGVPIRQFFSELNQEINNDNVYNGAAAIGFYLTLAIFPAMILVMTIIPYLPIDRVDEAIMELLRQALPPETFDMMAEVVEETIGRRRGGLLSFSILGTIWAVSTGMYSIMKQLNVTYDVKENRSFVRARSMALAMSVFFLLLVIGALSLVVFGGMIQDWIGNRFGFSDALLVFFDVFRWLVIVLALLVDFAMIYRYAPNTEHKLRFVSLGSVCGGLLLIVAALAFSFYTNNFANYNATYGSIGAVIILMLWLYIAGLAILLGAEINVMLERYSSNGKH